MPDPAAAGMMVKSVAGGFLAQSRDGGRVTAEDLKCVTRRQPTDREIGDMIFAMRVAKHVKSNAIVYARNEATVGIGAGQMSRLDSSRIAAQKAADLAREQGLEQSPIVNSVVASMPSFPLLTACLPPHPPAQPPSSSPAVQSKMMRSSPPPMKPGWPWSLPACGISATRTARRLSPLSASPSARPVRQAGLSQPSDSAAAVAPARPARLLRPPDAA